MHPYPRHSPLFSDRLCCPAVAKSTGCLVWPANPLHPPAASSRGTAFSFANNMVNSLQEKKRPTVVVFFVLLGRAMQRLLHNDPLRMAGATAFFTSFALPFILIILSQLLGFFYDETKIRSELFQTLSAALGTATMRQVVEILRAFRHLANNTAVTIAGVLFLFLVSTTLLMVIKGSINQLWHIKVVHGRGVLPSLVTRFQSVLIILGTAFLFFLSILGEGLKAYFDSTLAGVLPNLARYFTGALNYLLSVGFVTLWFAIIFRLLPDARVRWKVALTGALVTAVLFNIGKYLLRLLLVSNNLNTLYGTSASIVLLLLFVFYTSLILYFGAAFTRVWADHLQSPIQPRHYARQYRLVELE